MDVEISSQVVNGLFTVTGVGLIPWRVRDTYRELAISPSYKRIPNPLECTLRLSHHTVILDLAKSVFSQGCQ